MASGPFKSVPDLHEKVLHPNQQHDTKWCLSNIGLNIITRIRIRTCYKLLFQLGSFPATTTLIHPSNYFRYHPR